MRRLLLWMTLALPVLAGAAMPEWLQPPEGAVITGKATLQTSDLGGRESTDVHYYLQAAATPDFQTFMSQYADEFANANGDPMVYAFYRRYVEYAFLRASQVKLVDGQAALAPVNHYLHPPDTFISEDKETGSTTYQSNDDFTKPLEVDFSYFLPGAYRLIIEVNDHDQKTGKSTTTRVARNIVLKTSGTAPVPTLGKVTISPSGTLQVPIQSKDADAAEENLSQLDISEQNSLASQPLFAIDGKLAGMGQMTFSLKPGQASLTGQINLAEPWEHLLSPGPHHLSALIEDAYGNMGITTITINLPFSYLKLAAFLDEKLVFADSTVPVHTALTLQAQATGGQQVEYAFSCFDGKAWAVLCDWSPEAAYSWTPAAPGSYTIKAQAREGTKTLTSQFTVKAGLPLSGVNFLNAPTKPPAGSTIVLKAAPVNGCDVEYRFEHADGASLDVISGESSVYWHTQYEWTITNAKAGQYTIRLRAREAGSTQEYSATARFTVGPPAPLTGVRLTAYPETREMAAATTIQLGALRVGATDESVSYQFFALRGKDKWVALGKSGAQPHAEANVVIGPNRFRVTATEKKSGRTASAELAVTGRKPKPTTGITLKPSLPSPQPLNTGIRFEVAPNGDDWVRESAVEIQQDGAWIPLTDSDGGGMHPIWYPTTPGTYQLRARGKGEKGQEFTATITYTITP